MVYKLQVGGIHRSGHNEVSHLRSLVADLRAQVACC